MDDPFGGFGDGGFGGGGFGDEPYDDGWPKDQGGFEQSPPTWPAERTFP